LSAPSFFKKKTPHLPRGPLSSVGWTAIY
jgi:hypothetical protein